MFVLDLNENNKTFTASENTITNNVVNLNTFLDNTFLFSPSMLAASKRATTTKIRTNALYSFPPPPSGSFMLLATFINWKPPKNSIATINKTNINTKRPKNSLDDFSSFSCLANRLFSLNSLHAITNIIAIFTN